MGSRPYPLLNCRESAEPMAALALEGPLPTWNRGAPSKTGSVLGAFDLSVHILCGDKLPKAGGQGILGSRRRTGPDVVLWGGIGV